MITLFQLNDLGWPYSTTAFILSLFVAGMVLGYLVRQHDNKNIK